MRTFIAIETPENISSMIEDIQSQLPNQEVKQTLTKRPYHLTLKFLGEVKEDKIEHIKESLKTINLNKFQLTIDKIGFFPNDNSIRVIWLGFKDNTEVNELQKQIDNKLSELRFQRDNRFHPHITLARIKFIKDKTRFKESIKAIKIPETSFNITSFKLIKSTLISKGPVYEDLGEYTL